MNKNANDESCPKCGKKGPVKLMSAVSSVSSGKENITGPSSSCAGSGGFS